ncbi:unnamed protein product [Mytilus edulis]|uniref:Uncharacterized protein n=1 Tax=Mytilus edulis TaxID=6550 RepID=A0A8S3SA83_MYTED|nr:unnamed protein product [Mytilus edulis]
MDVLYPASWMWRLLPYNSMVAYLDRTRTMRNQRCLLAAVNEAGYPPAVRKAPCNNVLPFRCSPAYTSIIKADTLNTTPPEVAIRKQHCEKLCVSPADQNVKYQGYFYNWIITKIQDIQLDYSVDYYYELIHLKFHHYDHQHEGSRYQTDIYMYQMWKITERYEQTGTWLRTRGF